MRYIRAIFGTGGFGREVMEIAKRDLPNGHELLFVVDKPESSMVNDTLVLSLEELAAIHAEKFYCVAVGNPTLRANVAKRLHYRLSGAEPFNIISARSTIHPTVRLGRGAIILDGARISSNAKIGDHFHANYNAIVGHDCKIADFVTLAPACGLMGQCYVGESSWIGAGAMIHPNTRVGIASTVGMGAIVLRDVKNGETVVGNPARTLTRSQEAA